MKRKYLFFIIIILAIVGLHLSDKIANKRDISKDTENELKAAKKQSTNQSFSIAKKEEHNVLLTALPSTVSPSNKTEPRKTVHQFSLYKSDRLSSILSFQTPEFKVEEREINGKKYSIISSEGKSRPLNNKGLPSLPVFKQELLIPVGSTPKLVMNENKFREIKMENPPIPGVGPIFRKQKIPEPTEGSFYSSAEIYPKSEVRISRNFTFRGLDAVTVFVSPFRYDNANKVLRVYDDINFTVETPGSEEILLSKPLKTRDFIRSAEETFINYEEAGDEYIQTSSRSLPTPEKGKILIVTPEKFLSVIGEFVQWKKQIGFTVETHIYRNEGIDSLKNTITNKISNGTSHVIIMGDREEIPSRTFAYGYNEDNDTNYWVNDSNYDAMPTPSSENARYLIYTDLFYAGIELHTNPYLSDYTLDCLISRIPTSSAETLNSQLNKMVLYEQGEMFDNEVGNWQNTVLLTASEEGGEDSYRKRKDYQHLNAQQSSLNGTIFTNCRKVYENNKTSLQYENAILSSLNSGSSLVYYLGHGGPDGWFSNKYYTPDIHDGYTFKTADLTHLTSGLPSLSIQPVCQTGCFYNNCFAENQLQNDAFIGLLASTSDTFWNPPMVQIEEFTTNLADDEYETTGGLIFDSIQQATFWANSNSRLIVRDSTIAQLHYLGDCSMGFRTKTPQTLEIVAPDSITFGEKLSATVKVNGSVAKGVAVTLIDEDSDLHKVTDNNGVVEFGTLQNVKEYKLMSWERNSLVTETTVTTIDSIDIRSQQYEKNSTLLNLEAVIDGSHFQTSNALFYIVNGKLKAAEDISAGYTETIKVNYMSPNGNSLFYTINLTDNNSFKYSITLKPKWNLIGSPVNTSESLKTILREKNTNSPISYSVPFSWSSNSNQYELIDSNNPLQEQKGLWLYSSEESAVNSIEFTGQQGSGIMTELNSGWNLYSPVIEHTAPQGAHSVWEWNPDTQQYQELSSEKLIPTIGYWVFIND